MKILRNTWLLGAALCLALPSVALAQAPPSGSGSPAQSTAPPSSAPPSSGPSAQPAGSPALRLHLTPDQRAKIKSIRQTTQSQIQDARNDSTLAGPARRQKLMQIRQDAEQQIEALLSPDQLATWKEIQAERQQNHPAGSAGGARAGRAGNPPGGDTSGSTSGNNGGNSGGNSSGNANDGSNPTPATPE